MTLKSENLATESVCEYKISELCEKSKWLRKELFEMAMRQKSGHIPSCFSCVEIMISLYYGGVARIITGKPEDPERDRIIVSKGHAAMVQYPILADFNYFQKQELEKFTMPGGLLGMYADNRIPGIESISGSLGHGVGIGAGMALAAKDAGIGYRSFVILGDGECYEGSIWESAMFAAHHKIDNLVVIVDKNKLCILGKIEKLLNQGDLAEKWKSFGWHTISVNGHSHKELHNAFSHIGKTQGKPLAIIADTIKGKGISFMEGRHEWHNRMPDDDLIEQARIELNNSIVE